MSTYTLHHRASRSHPLVLDGVLAGLLAGVIVDAFLFATGTLTWPRSYQFIASAIAGKAAFASTAYVPLGIALHFAISAAWGALFGLAAQRYHALIEHPTAAGLGFGLVVMAGMQLVLLADGMWHAPNSGMQIVSEIVSHTVFFGLPIAWYVSRAARRGLLPPA